jgi:MFS transporter, DHA2 family, multidrug resistance protein
VAVCGVGYGMFFSPNARQIIASAPHERTAAAGALFSTIRGAGQTLGATAVAAVLALIAGYCSLAVLRPSIRSPRSV